MSLEIVEHQPPRVIDIANTSPLTFLAGPIQGAPDWQREVIKEVGIKLPDLDEVIHFANPRREQFPRRISQRDYRIQTRWERENIFRAANKGVNVFWLAQEVDYAPVPNKPGRPYGQTTRFEWGIAYALRSMGLAEHVVFGMEPGYKGSEKYYLDCADDLNLTIHRDLESLSHSVSRHLLQILEIEHGAV